jgi:hypothetical protein
MALSGVFGDLKKKIDIQHPLGLFILDGLRL